MQENLGNIPGTKLYHFNWLLSNFFQRKIVDSGAPSTSTARPNRFGRKTILCVWWDQRDMVYCELLKPGETVNTKRDQQQLADLNHSPLEERPEYRKGQHKQQSRFPSLQCSITYAKTGSRYVGSIQPENSTPCALLTRPGCLRLSLVCIDRSLAQLLSSALVHTTT